MNVKKLVLTNLPYVLIGLVCTNLGEAWRMASGSDASEKILSLFGTLPAAFGNPLPSMNALDLLVGLACGLLLRLAVYLRGKNAKKYRHGYEYGAARWGTAEDIRPYVDPVFKNNIIFTQTERLTMNSRPKDPKTARNKNVLIVGGSGSRPDRRRLGQRQDEVFHQAEFDAAAQLIRRDRPQRSASIRDRALAGARRVRDSGAEYHQL